MTTTSSLKRAAESDTTSPKRRRVDEPERDPETTNGNTATHGNPPPFQLNTARYFRIMFQLSGTGRIDIPHVDVAKQLFAQQPYLDEDVTLLMYYHNFELYGAGGPLSAGLPVSLSVRLNTGGAPVQYMDQTLDQGIGGADRSNIGIRMPIGVQNTAYLSSNTENVITIQRLGEDSATLYVDVYIKRNTWVDIDAAIPYPLPENRKTGELSVGERAILKQKASLMRDVQTLDETA